jgi:hypothetical protein
MRLEIRSRGVRSLRRGSLLLEAVVAMTILVSAIGILGAQLVGGMNMTVYAEEQTRAAQLVDRMLAFLELDPNTVTRFVAERQADGDFGKQFPEWFWRASAEEMEETKELEAERKLSRITIEILHQPGAGTGASLENAKVVRRLHMLKAAPGMIDLEKHFGVPADKVATIKELLAGIAPAALLENGEIDLRVLMQTVGMQDLFALMPLLSSMSEGGFAGMGGGGGGGIADMLGKSGMSPDDLLGMIQNSLGGEISPEMLQTLLGGLGGLEGLGDLSQLGDLSKLGNLTDLLGGAGGGQAAQILQFIQSQLGDQLSPEDLGRLMDMMGSMGGGGGTGGGKKGGGPGGSRTGGGRPGGPDGGKPGGGGFGDGDGGSVQIDERESGDKHHDIREIAEERIERNRQWNQHQNQNRK